MRTSTSRASKAHVSLWKFFAALLLAWICVPMSQVSAQTYETAKACWVLTKPIVNGNARGTLTFTYAEGDNLKGKKLYNNEVVDASSAVGEEIVDGEPIDDTCHPYWLEKQSVEKKDIKTVVFDASFAAFRPTSCKKWFDGCASLREIEGIEYLNTENVTDMGEMFYGCTILPKIDLTHFNTAKVQDMSNMFHGCTMLTSLDISRFNTERVTTTEGLFYLCMSLTTLDLGNFNPKSLTNTTAMFAGCVSLQSIYACDWSSTSITQSIEMFSGCEYLVGATAYDENKIDATMANGLTGYFMPRYTDGNGKVTYFEKNENNQIVLNLYNANPFVVSTAYNINKGTYTRKNMPSNWGTLCVPFIIDVTNQENSCEIYKFHTVEGENLYIEKVNEGEIAAGTPVIVKRTQGTDLKVCSPERNQAIVIQPVRGTETSHLEGTFVEQKLEGTSNYFIAKDKFWQVSGYDNEGNTIKGVNVPPFRATITAKGTQAQSLGIVVIDETNGIDLTPTVDDLLSDKTEYFDLQGRRLDGPQKGINLVRTGGKTRKVVIK